MSEAEKKALLKLIQDSNEVKKKLENIEENIDYLVEAMQLVVEIETRNVEKGKR